MLHTCTPEHCGTTTQINSRSTASLLSNLSKVVEDQLADGTRWLRWQLDDERLSTFKDLDAVQAAWNDSSDAPVRDAVAALAVTGSVRGGADDLAALAALILLRPGVGRLASQVHDLCDPEDVVSTVWFEIRRLEPAAGPNTAHHLLRRAHQRLIREHRRPLEVPTSDLEPEAVRAQVIREDSESELIELLRWARAHGVVPADEAALLAEVAIAERDGASPGEALRIAGERRGWAVRTARRHRQRALTSLRTALPAYLAATA